MGPPRSARAIAVLSAPGTLAGIDPLLERAGARVIRISTVRPTPVPEERWRARVDRIHRIDVLLVTSRRGVAAGIVPWLRRATPSARSAEFWAVGPTTARALRSAGVRRVHRPSAVGALALARAFAAKSPCTIVYFRSDRAGSGLARSLRRHRHHVVDLIVYRLGSIPKLAARARRDLAAADLWVATSPSSLDALRAKLGARTFSALARSTDLVVLGQRTGKSARALGFRRVAVAPAATTQRFTRYLLSELRHARP
jgi:uroporphyrinogen-III synthase